MLVVGSVIFGFLKGVRPLESPPWLFACSTADTAHKATWPPVHSCLRHTHTTIGLTVYVANILNALE